MIPYNKKLKSRARELRKNMTKAERLLWSKIRRKQLLDYQFYRQKPIGNYIVDFYCPKANLIIEVDGGQHFHKEPKEYDEQKNAYLEGLGFHVERFSNYDVLVDIEGVVSYLFDILKKSP